MTIPYKNSERSNLEVLPRDICPTLLAEAWMVLSTYLRPPHEDAAFWWRMTGPPLALLLLHAGYDLHSQYKGLLFHYQLICPRLGARPGIDGVPGGWKSFMTDDFSPLEFSWSWASSEERPQVRYSIEAIGADAGKAVDPFNQTMTMELVDQLHYFSPDVDLERFHHFARYFRPDQSAIDSPSEYQSHPTSIGLGFEFGKGEVSTKAYFAPVTAGQTRQSTFNLVSSSIRALEGRDLRFPALDQLINFIGTDSEGSLLEVVGLAIDCVKPETSRLKIYFRASHTSFDSVYAIMTMGGRLHGSKSESLRKELRELWQLVLGLDELFSSTEELEVSEHPTSGVLYYFDIKPGKTIAEPKLYIPVKLYGRNDLDIAQGLGLFFKRRGNDRFVADYMRVLEGMCAHRFLESGRGLQTYIACAVHQGSLRITSYLAPEVYHKARWAA